MATKKTAAADTGKKAITDEGKPVTLAANAAEVKEKHGVKVVTSEQDKDEEGMHVTSAVVADDKTKEQVGIDPDAKPTEGMVTSDSLNSTSIEGDTTESDDDRLARLKAVADENDIGYGATIGEDTLAERLEEAGVDTETTPTQTDEPEVTGDTVEVTVDVNEANPNPVRLRVNGKPMPELRQGEPRKIPRDGLGALRDSNVSFTTNEED